MLCISSPLLLAFANPSRVGLTTSRVAAPHMTAWATLDATTKREDTVACLNELSTAGEANMWNTMKLSPRPVSLGELCRTTKLEEGVLDPTASEFSLEDIQGTFIKVLIGATVGSTLWAVGTDALGLDAGLRFTGTYLIAGIPIGVVAIGSVAPGILFLPVEAFMALTANEEEKRNRGQRVCRHEAAHLLCAYVMGVPVSEVVTEQKGPRVVVYDEELVTQPGALVAASQINALAVVALSGLMAEAQAYGKALGAAEDLALLNSILVRANPPIPPQQQQDITRYAALMAWTILQKHAAAYEAITAGLEKGQSVAQCLEAAEKADKGSAAAAGVAAAARAEAITKETPQEKAARERAEDAARGRF